MKSLYLKCFNGKCSKRWLSGPLSIILAMMMFTPAFPVETQSVMADGIAPVIEGNTANARDNAINDGLRKAIEQSIGTMVSSETIVQNFQLLTDRIYSRTQGYIQNYRIISEGMMEANIYKVSLQATVSMGGLKDDLAALGLLIQKKGMPRVLFLIAEQNVGQEYYAYWWSVFGGKSEFKARQGDMGTAENAITGKFLEKGFNIVDHDVQSGRINLSFSFGVADLTDASVRTIGSKLDAEIVIFGKASARSAGGVAGSGMLSSQATISAKAVRVDTGGVIASAQATGAAVYTDDIAAGIKALEKVSAEVADKLVEQISSKWGQEVAGSSLVQTVVSGISNYGDFVKFKSIIQTKIRGVEGIFQRGMSSGVATLDIQIKGSAQALADDITLIDFKDFVVNVTNVSDNKVELTMAPKIK